MKSVRYKEPSPRLGYALAFAAVLLAVGLRWVLYPILGNSLPLVTLFGAVAFAVWIGGVRPGLIVMAVGYIGCAYLLISPRANLGLDQVENFFGLLAYLATCGIIIWFGEAMRTARHRAEVERETLRVTLGSMGDGVITTDAEGHITSLNAVAESLTGWTLDEASGLPLDTVFRIINETTRQPVENPATRALREGVVVGLANHTILISKDGTEQPIDDSAAPIRDEQGKIIGCVLIFRDFSVRRRTERILQESEGRKKAIFQTALDCIITIDHEGKVIEFNSAAERTFGYRQEEVVGKELATLIVPVDFRDRHRRGIARYLATERSDILDRRLELTALRSDGNEFEIELAVTRISFDGPPIFTAYIRDISERRRLEAQNAARLLAAQFLASIVESSGDAIISKSLDGIIQTWNPAAERLFGYQAEEAIGRHISLLIPSDRAEEEAQIIHQILAGQRVENIDTVRKRSDGSLIPISLTVSPIRDESGNVIGASKIVRDISRRRHDEERIYGLVAELKLADRRKDEFLAVLAHELRGPMAPLRNMLEIIKRADGDEELLDEARSTMERQLEQLVRLVDDLIDVGRITRNKIELRKGRIELASIIHQSVEASRPLAEGANHTIMVTLPDESLYLEADPVRLTQVFTNILNNACKYSEPGGTIWLTAERQAKDVLVKIRDTGMGIPPEKLDSVFEMFTQIDRTLERSQGGLGIGLTLVKRLVELHGGAVTAYSEGPGTGSEFTVRLPVLVEQRTAMPEPTATAAIKTVSRRFLVVDDNVDSATSLAMLLKIVGNETQTVHDGLAAVETAEQYRPDVILLDIGLPKLNGYEACRRIREQDWSRGMTVIALTGWGQESDRRLSQEAGFDYHLVKPVEFATLMAFLNDRQPNAR